MRGRSKVLVINDDLEWYDEIDPKSFYEKHFERTFLSKLHEVYPDYIGIPFGLTLVNDDNEASKPDLAMVKSDFSDWYIIEVEMDRHSWEGHVEKQVRVFSTANYIPNKVANHIVDKLTESGLPLLDYHSLVKMVETYRPKVMVIANELKKEWEEGVKKYKASLSIFQIYKGINGFELYRIAGHTPYHFRNKSHCNFHPKMSNLLEVYHPDFISEPDGNDINVYFKGRLTRWLKKVDNHKVYLIYKGSTHSLQLEKDYLLGVDEQNDYYLIIN